MCLLLFIFALGSPLHAVCGERGCAGGSSHSCHGASMLFRGSAVMVSTWATALFWPGGKKTVQNNTKKKKKHAHTRNFSTLFADVDYVKLLLQLAPGEIWLLQQWLTVTGQIGCHYTAINKQTSICILLLLLPECLTGITIVVFAMLPRIYNEFRIVISIVFDCVDLICR